MQGQQSYISGISAMMRFKADRRAVAPRRVNGTRTVPKQNRNDREPHIRELLTEPIVRALMAKDRTSPREVLRLLRSVRARRIAGKTA